MTAVATFQAEGTRCLPPSRRVRVLGRELVLARTSALAYWCAFLALVAAVLDATAYPAVSDGGLKLHGIRVYDALAALSLALSMGPLLSGRLRVPRALFVPLGIIAFVYTCGGAVGFAKHASHHYLFAECHVVLYLTAFPLAWLQVPTRSALRHEWVLLPLTFAGTLALLPRTGLEKGGDLSTMAAVIAVVLLARHAYVPSAVVAVLAAALDITGGQRAALLFSLPPLVIAFLVVVKRNLTNRGITITGIVLVAIGGGLVPFSDKVSTAWEDLLHKTFQNGTKTASSNSRREQLQIATDEIHQSPFFGHGLGHQYVRYDPTSRSAHLTDITHDIYVDFTLRFGFVGLGLLVVVGLLGVAKLWSMRDRLTTTRVLLTLALVGQLAHGAVESIVDKPRFMVVMAWVVAVLLTTRDHDERAGPPLYRRAWRRFRGRGAARPRALADAR